MENFKSGQYINQGYYKSFQPNLINREWMINDPEILSLLSKADRELGRLDTYSHYANIDLFISMHIVKEATQSTKIEGTQTNIEEAFLQKEDLTLDKRDDWEEVQNYITAMKAAVGDLEHLPISSRLIKNTHKTLISGVRGEHKLPGEYRKSQNWIGGATIDDAVFVPPVHTSVHELMSDLEKFANDEFNILPDLLKVAIIHYQFETIHPFLDGNGRIGRLLIPVYLVSKDIIRQPILYLSDFFEKHRSLYYENLMKVRKENDLKQWLKFFLVGVIQTARIGVETFDGILNLQKEIEEKLNSYKGKTDDARKIVAELYINPLTNAHKVEKLIEKSYGSAYKQIAILENLGIISEITGGQRGKIYAFQEYIDLFKK
ncbi:Fic family protein [Chryseobacterium suipulveris]|uniref:Fic family protein n=1 Tax=Chryseobacterium suipulveris TaxID=2929800 RepID=A0ABY4BTU2_9FLAO|nr:Fic family protein [Chryseobacterium suipulveris]UOE41126.1 Fic family protein [Chryseobacterium suipulveris]